MLGQPEPSITVKTCFFPRFTYEVSPVFVLMEEVLLKKMQSIVGWSDDVGDGIFCPGNTDRILLSLVLKILMPSQMVNICLYSNNKSVSAGGFRNLRF